MAAVVYENMSNDDYHGDKASISRSGIVEFMRSPFHYWNTYLNPDRPVKEPTEAVIFGSAFHMMILEPHLFVEQYAIRPEGINRTTTKGKLAYAEFEIEAKGKTIIKHEQFELLKNMQRSIQSHQQAWDLIENARYELSYFWKDENSGVLCKARPDILHSNMIVDLKTIADASPKSFQKAMISHCYHLQGAMQIDGVYHCSNVKIDDFICMCVEKTYPFAVGIYLIEKEAIERGRIKYKEILLDIKIALAHNHFPSYETQIVGLPSWA